MIPMEKKIYCDLCGAQKFKKLYLLDNFNIKQCTNCKLVCRDIVLSSNEASELYGKGYFMVEQPDYFFNNLDKRKIIFSNRLKDIEAEYKKIGTLLDVGCAVGTFLLIARASGWGVKGVEISEFASRYAVEEYQLDVLTGELASQHLPELSFDVITFWDAIDHAEFPQKLLEHSYRLLKPGGIIILETTMEDSLLYRFAHYIYYLSFGYISLPVSRCHPLHHSTFYSSKTMHLALEKAGFFIIRKQASNLPSDLINTNKVTRFILGIISFFASMVRRPLEVTFYGKKNFTPIT